MSDYSVDMDCVLKQIGREGFGRFQELVRWLYPGKGFGDFRIAPSVIARCEAQLLGISSPRFALRVRMANGALVNLRRLEVFANNARDVWPAGELQTLVQSGRSIADSLFVPRAACAGFHVLEVDLGMAYGEGESIRGTPFAQQVPETFGLCGNTAAFIASVLMVPHIRYVYGPSEILAVSKKFVGPDTPTDEREFAFSLDEMTPDSIVEFFNHGLVGLRALNQFYDRWQPLTSRPAYRAALRAYLLSDMPLIVPVDLARMWGDGIEPPGIAITDSNKIPLRRKAGARQTEHHAVVFVGCHETEDSFLLNDPATYPFLSATFEQVLDARRYYLAKNHVPVTRNMVLEPPTFIAVTPKEVEFPLLNAYVDKSTRVGLLRVAQHLQTAPVGRKEILRFEATTYDPGDWRLLNLAQSDSVIDAAIVRWLPRPCVRMLHELLAGGEIPGTWYWIQYLDHADKNSQSCQSVWLWDATMQPPQNLRGGERFLAGILFHDRETKNWKRTLLDRGPSIARREQLGPSSGSGIHPRYPNLRSSLLSSFCPDGITTGRGPVPKAFDPLSYRTMGVDRGGQIDAVPVEAYVMMETETAWWIDKWRKLPGQRSNIWQERHDALTLRGESQRAVAFLADLDEQEIAQVADQLRSNFPLPNCPIIALASFVPEIARGPLDPLGETGIGAVRNLIKLARALQHGGHPTHTVELVAGSRHTGTAARKSAGEAPAFSVNSMARAVGWLIHNLGKLRADLTDGAAGRYVDLAIEPEPGAHFTLQDWPSIVRFSEELEALPNDDPIKLHVGLNLDIGHWHLSHITAEMLFSSRVVCRRVAHAHLAGFHKCAHFGDARPLDLNLFEDFSPWLKILDLIAKRKVELFNSGTPHFPRFDGYVSLELEAARSDEFAADAFLQTKLLGL